MRNECGMAYERKFRDIFNLNSNPNPNHNPNLNTNSVTQY
jgi:hypothetical protein